MVGRIVTPQQIIRTNLLITVVVTLEGACLVSIGANIMWQLRNPGTAFLLPQAVIALILNVAALALHIT